MKLSPRHYAKLLYFISQETLKKTQQEKIERFILLLQKQKHLALSKKIFRAFIIYYNQQCSLQPVKVTTAIPIGKEIQEQIQSLLKKKFPEKIIEMQMQKNTALLGGIHLQWDDQILDASIKKRIEKLTAALL